VIQPVALFTVAFGAPLSEGSAKERRARPRPAFNPATGFGHDDGMDPQRAEASITLAIAFGSWTATGRASAMATKSRFRSSPGWPRVGRSDLPAGVRMVLHRNGVARHVAWVSWPPRRCGCRWSPARTGRLAVVGRHDPVVAVVRFAPEQVANRPSAWPPLVGPTAPGPERRRLPAVDGLGRYRARRGFASGDRPRCDR
jgi:hypothetical protein